MTQATRRTTTSSGASLDRMHERATELLRASSLLSLNHFDQPSGIPIAEDGNPIFFVLPPGVQVTYERWMAPCRAGWEATGDPAFVIEALIYIATHRQPLPPWFTEAACAVLTERRTKGHVTRAFNAVIRRMRHAAVVDARNSGLTWKEARKCAAENLAGTAALGKASSMKVAYEKVQRDLKHGRSGLYITPRMPRVSVNAQTLIGGSRTP